ncbi:MAG: hypothetical protein ACTSPB_17585 [Candidatus Thorarchaeota archaeon]
MIKIKKMVMSVCFCLMALPCIFSIVSAENIPLNNGELSITTDGETGFLGPAYGVFEYVKDSSSDNSIRFNGSITFFNRVNSSVEFTFSVEPYITAREHEIVKKNYIFYPIPDVSWITIQDNLVVDHGCKNTIHYSISVPENVAYELRNDGGFVAYITSSPSNYDIIEGNMVFVVPKYKVFLTLFDKNDDDTIISGDDVKSQVVDRQNINPLYFIAAIVSFSIISAAALYFYFKIHKASNPKAICDQQSNNSVHFEKNTFSDINSEVDLLLKGADE